jgi:hypothetical protein
LSEVREGALEGSQRCTHVLPATVAHLVQGLRLVRLDILREAPWKTS